MDEYDAKELAKTEEGRAKICKFVFSKIDHYLKSNKDLADNPYLYYILENRGIISDLELQIVLDTSFKYNISALKGREDLK
ncbi:MAG: hypothetical protein ACRCX2_04860 [Paraclostridium sp.]